jgi:transcription elongation GreA/GreB family factor
VSVQCKICAAGAMRATIALKVLAETHHVREQMVRADVVRMFHHMQIEAEMSRAFVKEVEHEIDDLPDRPLSPHPNYVTAEGLAAIERTLSRFETANKAATAKNDRTAIAATQRELRYWIARRSTAKVVEPAADKSKVHFGATVTVQRNDGRAQTFRIVGEDEAEPARGTVSYVSPFARAVLGGIVGETVEFSGGAATITEIR